MSDDQLLRLLALVCRDLSAEDARVEIGGRPPAGDGRCLWVALGAQRRLVAVFDQPPPAPEGLRVRLAALAEAFSGTVHIAAPSVAATTRASLDDELAALCERAGADSAVVVDASSPVLWGRSHRELGASGDVDRWLAGARALEQAEGLLGGLGEICEAGATEVQRQLRNRGQREAAEAIARVARAWDLSPDRFGRWARCGKALNALRDELAGPAPSSVGSLRRARRTVAGGWYARGLADVYLLVLTFDEPWSEPRVEGAVRRAARMIEKLIAALPPLEPPPGRSLRLLRPD